VKATTDVAEAGLDQLESQQDITAGNIGEITSFVNAGTSVASKWMQGKQAGAFG
jgi:hypothetical protein